MQDERETSWVLLRLIALSIAAHVAAWAALGLVRSTRPTLRIRGETIEIAAVEQPPGERTPEPEPPDPEPEVEAPPPAPAVPPPRPRRERTTPTEPEPQRAPPEPPPVQPPALEEAIADFSGHTLTNDTGLSWQSAVGNGAPIDGPIGPPGAAVTGRRREGAVDGTGPPNGPGGPRVVPLADLSRPPSPRADLDALLQRQYPPRARQLGIEGHVVVRFRILPDGSVTRVRIRSETPPDYGFADACRRTIELAQWEPPLAADGSAVATDASFECEFAVGL
jgi:protein TonB